MGTNTDKMMRIRKILPLLLLWAAAAAAVPSYAWGETVFPGQGCAQIRLGDAAETVLSRFPSSAAVQNGAMEIPGAQIRLNLKDGRVDNIVFSGGEYATPGGLRVGATLEEIRRTYSSRYLYVTDFTAACYEEGMGFVLEKGRITALYVFPPKPNGMLGDGLIVPGERAGLIRLGMSVTAVEQVLGKAESVTAMGEPGRGKMHFYNSAHGLIFITERNRINGIIIFSPLYRTQSDIAVGVSEERVTDRFGQKEKTRNHLSYGSGISFEILEGKVRGITLSLPGNGS